MDEGYAAASAAVRAAVDRALGRQQDVAVREVDALLDAVLRVTERMAPAAPRVADVVAEAGSSNQTFYRYFSGKDELMLAALQRGLHRVVDYLRHQMGKSQDPREQVAAWVRGVLAQVTNRAAARQSAALNAHVTRPFSDHAAGLDELGTLLVPPLQALGSARPATAAMLIREGVFGLLQHHLAAGTTPSRAEVDHVVAFCLRAVGHE